MNDSKDNVSNGLTSAQVLQRQVRYGYNELTPPERDPWWKQYLETYDDPIIKILLVAVVLSLFGAYFADGSIFDILGIVAAIVLATGLAFINEYRSGKEFDILNAQRDLTGIKVIRDGVTKQIPLREVVVDDLVELEQGDLVPADGRFVNFCDDVTVDDSAFTGESKPSKKVIGDSGLKGTYVTGGRAQFSVESIGDHTEQGKIAASLGMDHANPTPLEIKLTDLADKISKFGYAMASLIIVALVVKGYLSGELTGVNLETGMHLLHYFMIAVVIIVVAVPEGLPMSVALSLSIAMRKMTAANCLVRKMIACETIGSATTICTDKTGTLTKNEMQVSASKEVVRNGNCDNAREFIALNVALNTTANLEGDKVIGSATEGALLKWMRSNLNGFDYAKTRIMYTIIHQNLFTSDRKMMSTVIPNLMLVKGAPDVLATKCSGVPADLNEIMGDMTSKAMRTLAFAHKSIKKGDDYTNEDNLIWDGIVGIRDDIRDNVPDAIGVCHAAGVKVRMITGDNIETAKVIAKECGIFNGDSYRAILGEDFRKLSPEEQRKIVNDIDVMARSQPMDKLAFAQALMDNGHVVAMTGDGTNDAPALKSSNVGLSMGISGTEVAREASDIVLLDDSFPTIKSAVWWGRALYENIQRFLIFQLTINIAACILAFIAPLLGYPNPFTIVQLLWINIIMDTLAALALCSEIPHPGLMDKKPIPRDSDIITPYMIKAIGITAVFYIVAGLANMQYHFLGGNTVIEQTTIFFAAFVLAQIVNGINCRAINGVMPPFFKGNPTFWMVMAGILVAQIVLVQFGGEVVGVVPLTLEQWGTAGLAALSVLIVGLIVRVVPYGNSS